MTAAELQAVMDAALYIGLVAGVMGAICFRCAEAALWMLGECLESWEARRMRIARARMRHVHGPLLVVELPRWSWARRSAWAAVLRRKHMAEACHG